jgi:glycosyltransferase involved in cell wall biosynthesis
MVRISVIIPAYNAAATIEKTIQSVFAQTFQDFEIILVDDGSSDGTLRVLERFTDLRLRIFSFTNAGVSASRNRGTKYAYGAFIAFLDADDLWTPCKLAAQLEALEAHPEAALAYSWVDYINSEGNLIGNGTRIQETENLYSRLLLANALETASNPLIRRSALEEVLGFDEALSGGEEWELYLRLTRRHPASVVNKVQVLYRQHPQSSSANLTRMERDPLQVIEKAFTDAPPAFRHLKRESTAHLYRYLTYKALEGNPGPVQALKAMRYLYIAILNAPNMLHHPKALLSILLEIAMTSWSSPDLRAWLTRWQKKSMLPTRKVLLSW